MIYNDLWLFIKILKEEKSEDLRFKIVKILSSFGVLTYQNVVKQRLSNSKPAEIEGVKWFCFMYVKGTNSLPPTEKENPGIWSLYSFLEAESEDIYKKSSIMKWVPNFTDRFSNDIEKSRIC